MNITTYEGGSPSGPIVTILGGVHGNELSPIHTLMTLVKDESFKNSIETYLDCIAELNIINCINTTGLLEHQRGIVNTPTNDINRFYNFFESNLTEELKTFLDAADIVLDIHASANCSEFALIDYNENAQSLVNWCMGAGVKFAVRYSGGKTLKRYIQDKGGISLTLEMDGLDKVNKESVATISYYLKSLLENSIDIEIVKSKPKGDVLEDILSYSTGLVEYAIQPNQFIEKGDIIATILSANGVELQEITSPITGYIVVLGRDYVGEAGFICSIQDIDSWRN